MFGKKRPKNLKGRPIDDVIAVAASEAVAHDVAIEGAVLNSRDMGYRYDKGDRGPTDFEHMHLLLERYLDKYDKAQREEFIGHAREQSPAGGTHQPCPRTAHGKEG